MPSLVDGFASPISALGYGYRICSKIKDFKGLNYRVKCLTITLLVVLDTRRPHQITNHMKWILVALLGGVLWSYSNAQTTGSSPCRARTVAHSIPSSIGIQMDGRLFHNGNSGDNVHQVDNFIPEGEDGWLSIEIDDFGEYPSDLDAVDGVIELGMVDHLDRYTYFTITPERTKHCYFKDNTCIGHYEHSFAKGDVLRIECKGLDIYLKQITEDGEHIIATLGKPSTPTRFWARIAFTGGSIIPLEMTYSTGACPPYVELKSRLDGSFLQQSDDIVRFKFRQRYATPNSTDLSIPYKIYDWERNVAQSGTFDVRYGMNWEDLALSGLAANTFYTLEINANKEEHYFLRFKTKPQ